METLLTVTSTSRKKVTDNLTLTETYRMPHSRFAMIRYGHLGSIVYRT